MREEALHVADFVLIRNVGLKGKHKLADRWKSYRYVVVEQPNTDIPVYQVRLDGSKVEKVLHCNLLLPLWLPQQLPVVRNYKGGGQIMRGKRS